MTLLVVFVVVFSYVLARGRPREALSLLIQVLASFVAWIALLFVSAGELAWLPILALALIGVFPWTAARVVFAPLGMWRSAWALGELAEATWRGPGGGLVAGAWALLLRQNAAETGLRWLERRRDKARRICGAHVLGAGLLAAARGQSDTARDLLESLEVIAIGGDRARRLAREWLCAEAAERGQWRRAASIASRPGRSTRATRFVGGAAARLAELHEAPGDRRLRLLWSLAPRRRYTRSLLRRALRSPPSGIQRPTASPPEVIISGKDPLGVALALHVAILSRPPERTQMEDVESVGRAWDRALSASEIQADLRARAETIGAPSSERAIDELREDIERDLAGVARRAGHRLDLFTTSSPMVSAALSRLREELLSEIELAFDSLAQRAEARRAHAAIDEWREFLALRELYESAVFAGGLSLRRVAFPGAHQATCNLAVWLWNEREEHVIANAMFRWLLEEAIAVGDEEAISLQRHNVAPRD